MKIKYLLVLLVLLVPVGVFADSYPGCGENCPKVEVTIEVINDGSGTLTPNNFPLMIMNDCVAGCSYDEKRIQLTNIKVKVIDTLWSFTNIPPFPYKAEVDLQDNAYLSENGGSIIFTGDCEGTVNIGQIKQCQITINDGVLPVVELPLVTSTSTTTTPDDIFATTTPEVPIVQQPIPIIVNLQETIQQQITIPLTTTTDSTTTDTNQEERIKQLENQLANIQQQIIILLNELIRILQGKILGI